MKERDLPVTCRFAEGGEDAQTILLRSFQFFLQRELQNDSLPQALPQPFTPRYP